MATLSRDTNCYMSLTWMYPFFININYLPRLTVYEAQYKCLVPCPMPKRDQRLPVFRGIYRLHVDDQLWVISKSYVQPWHADPMLAT